MEKICNVEGCVHPVRAKGYCQKHYQNARRNEGKPVSTRPNVKSREPKVCSDKGCGNFVYAKGYVPNRTTPDCSETGPLT